jgi:hypothetical protein
MYNPKGMQVVESIRNFEYLTRVEKSAIDHAYNLENRYKPAVDSVVEDYTGYQV